MWVIIEKAVLTVDSYQNTGCLRKNKLYRKIRMPKIRGQEMQGVLLE